MTSPAGFGDLLWVVLAGGCVGLFAWQAGHRELLPMLLLENQIAPGRRMRLLAIGAAFAAAWFVLWLIAASLVRRRRRCDGASARSSARRWMSLGVIALAPGLLQIASIAQTHLGLVLATLGATCFLAYWGYRVEPTPAPEPAVQRALRPRHGLWGSVLVMMIAAYALAFSRYTVARHEAFATGAFDLGVFDQVMHSITTSGRMLMTFQGEKVSNFFDQHVSPIHYLVAPIYLLRPGPGTLLVFQSIWLAIGALPIYLMARRTAGSSAVGVILAATYLLHPALHGINTYDYHEAAIALPLLLFALHFLLAGHDVSFVLCLSLFALSKENYALGVAAVGLYLWLSGRRPRLGPCLALAGGAYFALAVGVVMPYFGGQPATNRYAGFAAEGFGGVGGIALTLATNPVYTLHAIVGNAEKLRFLAQMLMPLAFVPILAGGAWIMAVPAAAMSLLASYRDAYLLGNQYPAELLGFLFGLSVMVLARLRPPSRGPCALVMLLAAVACSYLWGRWPIGDLPRASAHQEIVRAMMRSIPREASVSTHSDYCPHLSRRDRIRLFPAAAEADYILFDSHQSTNYWPIDRRQALETLMPLVTLGRYRVVDFRDGCALLARREIALEGGAVRLLEQSAAAFMQQYADRVLAIVVNDEAVAALGAAEKAFFAATGSQFGDLAFRGSYAGLFVAGRPVFERVDNSGPIDVTLAAGERLGPWTLPRQVTLRSAGAEWGKQGQIWVDGVPMACDRRGLNIVALDESLRYLASVNFDTHETARSTFLVYNPRPAAPD